MLNFVSNRCIDVLSMMYVEPTIGTQTVHVNQALEIRSTQYLRISTLIIFLFISVKQLSAFQEFF